MAEGLGPAAKATMETQELLSNLADEISEPDNLELTIKTLDYIKFHEAAMTAHKRLTSKRTEEIQHKIDHHKQTLLVLGLRLKKEYGHATTDVGNGTVTVKKKTGSVTITDEVAAKKWAGNNVKYWTNPAPKISLKAVREALNEAPDGTLIDSDGCPVEWAEITGKGDYSISYKHGTD